MNSLNSSVNSTKSLQQNEPFAKFYMTLDEMTLKTMSKADLLSIKSELTSELNTLKSQKTYFILSTNQHPKTRSYKNQMLQFEIRKNQLNENLSMLNRSLILLKEDYLRNEKERKDLEAKYLYYFWKTAQETLKTSDYKKVSEITQTLCPFPETLVR